MEHSLTKNDLSGRHTSFYALNYINTSHQITKAMLTGNWDPRERVIDLLALMRPI